MTKYYPKAGTPQRRHLMDYQNEFKKAKYIRRAFLFRKDDPEDMRAIEGLNALPPGERTNFVRKAIVEKLDREGK